MATANGPKRFHASGRLDFQTKPRIAFSAKTPRASTIYNCRWDDSEPYNFSICIKTIFVGARHAVPYLFAPFAPFAVKSFASDCLLCGIQVKKLHGVARNHRLLFILRHAGELFFD